MARFDRMAQDESFSGACPTCGQEDLIERVERLECGLQKTQELLVYVVGIVDPKWSAEADRLLSLRSAVGGVGKAQEAENLAQPKEEP